MFGNTALLRTLNCQEYSALVLETNMHAKNVILLRY